MSTLVVLFIGGGAIKQGGGAKMGKRFWKILKLGSKTAYHDQL